MTSGLRSGVTHYLKSVIKHTTHHYRSKTMARWPAVLCCVAVFVHSDAQLVPQVFCTTSPALLVQCAQNQWYQTCVTRHTTDPDTKVYEKGVCGCLHAVLGCTMGFNLCDLKQYCDHTADAFGCNRDWCIQNKLVIPISFEVQYSFADSYSLEVFGAHFRQYLSYLPAEWFTFVPELSGKVAVIISIPQDTAFNGNNERDLIDMLQDFPGRADMVALTGVNGRGSVIVGSALSPASLPSLPSVLLTLSVAALVLLG